MPEEYEDFAKIFISDKYGQILVYKSDTDNNEPAIFFVVSGSKKDIFSQCTSKSIYDESEQGEIDRDHNFTKVNQELAENAAKAIFGMFQPKGDKNAK